MAGWGFAGANVCQGAARGGDPGGQQRLALVVQGDAGAADQVARLFAKDLGEALRCVAGREDVALERQSLDHERHLTAGDGAAGGGQPLGDVLGRVLEMVAAGGDLVGQLAKQLGEGLRREQRNVGGAVDLAGKGFDAAAVDGARGGRRFRRGRRVGEEGREFLRGQDQVGRGPAIGRGVVVGIDRDRVAAGLEARDQRRQVGLGAEQDEFRAGLGEGQRIHGVDGQAQPGGTVGIVVLDVETGARQRVGGLVVEGRASIAALQVDGPPAAGGWDQGARLDRRQPGIGARDQATGRVGAPHGGEAAQQAVAIDEKDAPLSLGHAPPSPAGPWLTC